MRLFSNSFVMSFCFLFSFFLFLFHSLKTCTCRYKLTYDNIFLKTEQRINLAVNCRIGENSCSFLE